MRNKLSTQGSYTSQNWKKKKKKKKEKKKRRRYEMLRVHTTYALNPHPLKHRFWCAGVSEVLQGLTLWNTGSGGDCARKKREREREREKRELQDSSSFPPSLLLRIPQRNFLSIAGSFSLAMASQLLWVPANSISCPFCVSSGSSSSISGWFAVNHDELFSNSSNGEKMMMCPKLSCCCL